MRIPLFAIESRFVVKGTTFDDVLDVIRWSLVQCFVGSFPSCRHDGEPWTQSDTRRKNMKGSLLTKSTLCRVLGDWKMWKQIFRFPQHNETVGICWLCAAQRDNFEDTTTTAIWRNQRLSHYDVIARIRGQGKTCCPLMSLPFFRVEEICRVDWLHAMDLGVTADFLGQVLIFVLNKEPGVNAEQRLQGLKDRLEGAYARAASGVKIDNLTEGMLGLPGWGKLRAHAAEVRGLVPVVADVVAGALTGLNVVEQTIKQAMALLVELYNALSDRFPEAQAACADNSRRFATLYVALATRTDIFHVRPKLHLAQELLEHSPAGSNPTKSWTYRDEDFGGYVVQLFRPRGGGRIPATAGFGILRRFCARHKVPCL